MSADSIAANRPDVSSGTPVGPPGGTSPTGRAVGTTVAVTAALASLIAILNYSRDVIAQSPFPKDPGREFVYVPDPQFLRIVSLGHTAAAADLLWFRTINYFGTHYHTDRLYPWLFKMCDVVTDLDPMAVHVYHFAGVVLPWEANRPDDGIALLEKGLSHFPDSWYLHWLIGFNYYFFKNDLQKAAFHLGRAAELPGTHPYVSRLAAVVYAHGVDTRAAESFLRDLANSTQDESMRSMLSVRLLELQLGRDLDALDEAVQRFKETRGALPTTLEEMLNAGVVARLPREPFGGSYVLDPETGKVKTTSGHAALRLYESNARKEYQKGNPVHW
jgi:tetratricopeptide (TPR) repeat protein